MDTRVDIGPRERQRFGAGAAGRMKAAALGVLLVVGLLDVASAEVCILRNVGGEDAHLAVGESQELHDRVVELRELQMRSLEECILEAEAIVGGGAGEAGGGRGEERSCYELSDAIFLLIRRVGKEALEANVGCAVPEDPRSGCYVSVAEKLGVRGQGKVFESYWDIPKRLRSEHINPLKSVKLMVYDGLGSVTRFKIQLFAVALVSGCTYVRAELYPFMQHGAVATHMSDFLRFDDHCPAEKDVTALEGMRRIVVTDENNNGNRAEKGTFYQLERGPLKYSFLHEDALDFFSREGVPACGGDYHYETLARVILHAKFEAAQRRYSGEDQALLRGTFGYSETQGVDWVDPLKPGKAGAVLLKVFVHVRRGDVSGGRLFLSYEEHTLALRRFMECAGPLTRKGGRLSGKGDHAPVDFIFLISSEGQYEDFPLDEWKEVLAPYKMKVEISTKAEIEGPPVEGEEHLSQFNTFYNMMDSDVLMSTAQTNFASSAHAMSPHTNPVHYEVLLTNGDTHRGHVLTPRMDRLLKDHGVCGYVRGVVYEAAQKNQVAIAHKSLY